MRIGIIVDKFPSVSETFILNKVEGLCRRGHEVIVFRNSRHNDPKMQATLLSGDNTNLKLVDMDVPENSLQATRRMLLSPSVAVSAFKSSSYSLRKRIMAAIRDEYFAANPCDIYHFEFSGLATHYLPLFTSLKGKIVVSCRGSAEKVKAITQPGRKEELQQLFNAIDAVHCVSDDMAATVELYGAPAHKIFVNRPAIITSFFQPKNEKKSSAITQVLSIGRLTFQKGYLPGLMAFKKVVNRHPQVHWTIAGDGPMMEELKFYIHDLQLSSHVTLAGSVTKNKVFELLEQSHIFFLPSVYEGIANVVLEAMAMELAVVSSDCSGMKEVIHHKEDGLLAANYDADEMADHLLYLIEHPEQRIKLGIAARTRIENAFDLERQLDVFEMNYQKILTPVIA